MRKSASSAVGTLIFCSVMITFLRNAISVAAHKYSFTMFPGQSFNSWPHETVWHITTWNGECVVKVDPTPDAEGVPYAILSLSVGETCPVGDIFDADAAESKPWLPYPANATRKQLTFDSTGKDPLCLSNEEMLANTARINALLDSLGPGDTLVIPEGVHCMAAGVTGKRLTHVTIDIRGDLFFAQGVKHWSNISGTGKQAGGIFFTGSTNITVTSSNREGRVRANGCTEWYIQRLAYNAPGPPPLVEFGQDAELTFASSNIVFEHVTVQDGPIWQTWFNKVTNLIIRHVKVKITCDRPSTTIGDLAGAITLNTDGIDVFGSNVHIHDVDVTNGDDCICVKGTNDGACQYQCQCEYMCILRILRRRCVCCLASRFSFLAL